MRETTRKQGPIRRHIERFLELERTVKILSENTKEHSGDIQELQKMANEMQELTQNLRQLQQRVKVLGESNIVHGDAIRNLQEQVKELGESNIAHAKAIQANQQHIRERVDTSAGHGDAIRKLQDATSGRLGKLEEAIRVRDQAASERDQLARKRDEGSIERYNALKKQLGEQQGQIEYMNLRLQKLLRKAEMWSGLQQDPNRINDRQADSYEPSGDAVSSYIQTETAGNTPSGQSFTAVASPYESIDYFDFENHFRGSKETIRVRQKFYLPYFADCREVLDIGCGRGEFLELLKENNIRAKGVETYSEYVDLCCSHGLDVVCDDAVSYLEKCEMVDGIFMGQVVEHLELSYLIRFFELAYEKLNQGGILITETPNPTSLAIYSHAFYIDPTHNKPVHPLFQQYLMQKAGFRETEIIYTPASRIKIHIPEITLPDKEQEEAFNDAMRKVEDELFGSQDYALAARKR